MEPGPRHKVRSCGRYCGCRVPNGAPWQSRKRNKATDADPATLILPEDPIYPAVAKECSISGRVEVQFRISPEGNVYDARSVRGVPILARAAVEAVEARRYEPARLNGAPIDSQATTHFDFRLS